jgi:hypothetical protein
VSKILHLDVETAPAKYYVWNPYQKHPLDIGMMIEPGRMVMWGAKWHGSQNVIQMDERKGIRRMFKGVADLIAQADMVVTYNGDNFDLPWINGGMVQHRLPPLPPVASLDLFKTVRKLRYQSQKLAYIAPLLQIGEKVKHAGFSLWVGVMQGDRSSWQEMRKYNVGDVVLLESGYSRLGPYIKNHPALYPKVKGEAVCQKCGSTRVQFGGAYRSLTMIYDRFRCVACGKWGKIKSRG